MSVPLLERIPPQSLEAEQATLGAMLLEREAIVRVVDVLDPGDFYSPQHQMLYRAMIDLFNEKHPVDFVTLQARLQDREQLQDVGGTAYLVALHEAASTAAAIGHYARIVREKSVLRALIRAGGEIRTIAQTAGSDDIETVATRCAQLMDDALRLRVMEDEFVPFTSVLGSVIDELEAQLETDDHTWGIPTKIGRLDALISGWTPGTYVVVAARPQIGKTAFAWEQCCQAAAAGKRVAFFSLEMREGPLGRRWLANRLEIELGQIMAARFARGEIDNIVRVSAEAASWQLWVCPRADLTIGELRAQARRLATAQKGLDLIAVDYIQLLTAGRRCGNRNEEIGYVSQGLKALGQELNCPVLALSQLNRDAEREARWPRLSDLRDSGTIEQDADLVIFIVWPVWDREWMGTTPEEQAEAKGKRWLYVAKQRNGDKGKIEVSWSGAYQRFAALEQSREGGRPYWVDQD